MKKEKLIKQIQQSLDELGVRGIEVRDLDTQIVLGMLSSTDIVELVDTIQYDSVSIVIKHNGNELDWSDKDYRDMPVATLEEILEALQYYKIGFDKTLDVIRDEDY
jgi:hypothetical protein